MNYQKQLEQELKSHKEMVDKLKQLIHNSATEIAKDVCSHREDDSTLHSAKMGVYQAWIDNLAFYLPDDVIQKFIDNLEDKK